MPWEKSFDVNKTLEAAMQVFWQQGYQRTSMQDLIKSMGINPGSIYSTFGKKRDLFISVLRQYQQQLTSWFACLTAENTPRNAILGVFQAIFREVEEKPGQCNGCLLVNTALEVAPHDEEISQLVREGFDSLRMFYRNNIIAGQDKGEIPHSIDADAVTHSLVALTLGLRVISRLPFGKGELDNTLTQVRSMLC